MLRDYQNECLKSIKNDFQQGITNQIVSMATGLGKTVVFSNLPEYLKDILPGKMLVIAHREELIDQAIDKMKKYNPCLKIDKEMAEHHADPNADIIVASVATLGRKNTTRGDKFDWDLFDKIVVDEVHHSIAPSYINVLKMAGVLPQNKSKLLLGVSATPYRGDGKALSSIYSKIVFDYGLREGIENGWLSDIKAIKVDTNVDITKVHSSMGDFNIDELSNTINTTYRNELIVKAWWEHAKDRQTIAFTSDVQHAVDLAAMFNHFGIKAEFIHAGDEHRSEKIQKHKNKEIQILTNCGILLEGYDDWRIGCLLLARPTQSKPLFTQMCGRGTRIDETVDNIKKYLQAGNSLATLEKQNCIIIDFVDNTLKHDLASVPTLMGLNKDLDLNGNSLLESVYKLEQAQRDNPDIDFSRLKDINALQLYIDEINLFKQKQKEYKEQRIKEIVSSGFKWFESIGDCYLLKLPNKQFVKLKQNMLDKWDIIVINSDNSISSKHEVLTREDAFKVAEKSVVDTFNSNELKLILQKQGWHDRPASEKQLAMLASIFKNPKYTFMKQYECNLKELTRGKASELIDCYYANMQLRK
jgi:ATP-dependent helicase IRC3